LERPCDDRLFEIIELNRGKSPGNRSIHRTALRAVCTRCWDIGCNTGRGGEGRGRRMDNVEWLWRSLKYQDVYLRGYADGHEAVFYKD
jgi:hypothetical protein